MGTTVPVVVTKPNFQSRQCYTLQQAGGYRTEETDRQLSWSRGFNMEFLTFSGYQAGPLVSEQI